MKKIEIKNIKKGDRFWEKHLQFEATEDAHVHFLKPFKSGDPEYTQWRVSARCLTQNQPVVSFVIAEGLEHYGPELLA